jgi:predicted RNase H-like HicB family nuclease
MSAVQNAIRVNIYYSHKSGSFWANSPDLEGLAASGGSRAEVEKEARYAAEALFEIHGIEGAPEITFQDAKFEGE